jgi:hypothetical protein
MSFISKSIPSLFGGVSQQPAPLRGPSQCEASTNAYPSISVGLRKRPPTKHLADLRASTATDAFIAVYNYSNADKYVILLLDGSIEVYHSDGTLCTVTATDRTAWAANTAYSLNDVRMPTTPNGFAYRCTVAGTSHASNEPTWPTTLGNTVVDNTATWTCIPDYLSCDTPRSDFATAVFGDTVIIANKTVTTAMRADTSGGSLNSTVQTFSALPAHAAGKLCKIEGDNTNTFASYYVVSDGTTWTETLAPGEVYKMDEATLPHALTRTGTYTFTLDNSTWSARAVGNTTTVSNPSFIGKKINDVFLHRNRLGMIAGEFIVLSRSADHYNLYPQSATTVLDNDPIDLTTSGTKKVVLQYAIPFNTALLLFSDQTQYQFSGGDTLSPRSARIDPITEFESDTACRPVPLGQEVFFAVSRGTSTAIRNYFIDTEALTNDASDVSAHVPSYIPDNVFKLTASTTEDLLFAFSLDERNAIYCYKFYWQEDKKVQAAWQKFELSDIDTILGGEFINNICYLVIQRADGVYLETLDMQPVNTDDDVGYLVSLDRRTSLTGVYDAANDYTTWTLPYSDAGTFQVVLPEDFSGRKGEVFTCTRPANTTARVNGDLSAHPVYIGRQYEMRYRMSEIHYKDQAGLPVIGGKLQLRRIALNYSESGYFKVEVTPLASTTTYSYVFNGMLLGTSYLLIGTPSLASGTFRFPVFSNNIGLVVEVVNDSPMPSNLQSAEWEGEFTLKSRRQG